MEKILVFLLLLANLYKFQQDETLKQVKHKLKIKDLELLNNLKRKLIDIIHKYPFIFHKKTKIIRVINNINSHLKMKKIIKIVNWSVHKYFFETKIRGLTNSTSKIISNKSYDICSGKIKTKDNMKNCREGYNIYWNFLLGLRLKQKIKSNEKIINNIKSYLDS